MSDDRLIVSLDLPDALQCLALAERLGDEVGFYKIGLGMLTGGGLAVANELKSAGKRIFLDLKLFDISATIEAATRGVAAYGLDLLTVHGDPHVVRAADRRPRRRAHPHPRRHHPDLARPRRSRRLPDPDGAVPDLVTERARQAFLAGADGVIASPNEAAAIRALPEAEGRLIVTPGVRPAGAAPGDQKRTATPAEAVRAGADHIVVGRPVWAAPDPAAAARAILADLKTA